MLSDKISMFRQFFIFCFLPPQLVHTDNKCMECASTNLRGRWALTGFAQTFRDQLFSATCLTGTDTDHYSICSGYCMTYLFEDPDTVDSSNVGVMVVRGCQRRLLGITGSSTNLPQSASSTAYCEYDKDLARLNSQGNTVYIKAVVEFCTGDTCNTKVKDFSTACTGPTERCMYIIEWWSVPLLWDSIHPSESRIFSELNKTGSNTERLCYNCDAVGKNCNYDREPCYKKFCFKSAVKFQNIEAVHKSCSDINPFGSEEGCTYSAITTQPGNLLKLNGEMWQCYCGSKDYCNGTDMVAASAICVLIALFKIAISWC